MNTQKSSPITPGGGVLVNSVNRGRYAIGHSEGPDITSGLQCSIMVAGQWVPGRVEYSPGRGYYMTTDHNCIVGLCVGVRVKLDNPGGTT